MSPGPVDPDRLDHAELWDPGLQPERTAAAWTRTTLALAVVALVTTRSREGAAGLLVGFAALACTASLTLACARRLPQLVRQLHQDRMRPAFGLIATLAGLAFTLPTAALTLFLLP